MNTEQISRELRAILETRPEVKVCLLFGSTAKGERRAGSDIDVAICGERAFSADDLAELQLEISERLGGEVDLLDVARLNGLILTQVLSTGKRVINRNPELFAGHIKRMLYFSEDMLPNYRMILRAKAERFARGS